jgi:RTX calcium-binding nonapeptide repeat (4 copies)
MPSATVTGAHGQTVTLNFDSNANAALASRLAAAITAGVQNGSIIPAVDTDGPPPALPPGKTGEFVQTQTGSTILPHGYKAFVDTAPNSIVFGSGGKDETVLSSTGNLDFIATGGSGTVVAGGGNNVISIPQGDKGDWSINTGNGNDNVLASGGGDDTISAGGGHNRLELGTGKDFITSLGNDIIVGSTGQETVAAFGDSSDYVVGNASNLFFVGNGGSATIFGGTGSDTVLGGSGPDYVVGGTAGHNLLMGGAGTATLIGGGDGDVLKAGSRQSRTGTEGRPRQRNAGRRPRLRHTLRRRQGQFDANHRREGQRHVRFGRWHCHGYGGRVEQSVRIRQERPRWKFGHQRVHQWRGPDRPGRLQTERSQACAQFAECGQRQRYHHPVGSHQDHLRRRHEPVRERFITIKQNVTPQS